MSKAKPYCARTLRHVSVTLRKQARLTRGYPGAFPGQSGFTRSNIYDGLADALLHQAQAIEEDARVAERKAKP